MTGITASTFVQPADFAKELQQRVTMFHAGDELYSGAWLSDFQKTGLTAWHICTDKLRVGPLSSCDGELLQAFCAQTLARLARAFASHFDVHSQRAARDTLEALLTVHAYGQTLVWKQLALALACAELWLGTWAAAASLNTSLPATVRRELLVLPAELLFDSKALPLTDKGARQQVAASLFSSCDGVFAFLLQVQWDAEQSLRILSAWLRAVRKAQIWLPTCDSAQPLRHLAGHLPTILAAAEVAPAQASELAQQLAKWNSAPQEVAEILKPLLQQIMKDRHSMDLVSEESPLWMLPLLQVLAEDLWPRAVVGEVDLDCEAIAKQAFRVLEVSASWGTDVVDVEASIQVWHTFAETIHAALRASEESAIGSERLSGPTFAHPEKRSRRSQDRWHLPGERLREATMVNLLFQLLVQKLLDCMRLPEIPEDEDALELLQHARQAVETALRPWAALLTNADTWIAELWNPLQEVESTLAAMGDNEECFMAVEVSRDVEAVIWFFGAFCSCLPKDQAEAATASEAASHAVSALIPQIHQLDTALPPWKGLLWSSVCRFSAAVNSKLPPGKEPILLDWMLERPPTDAEASTMLEITELPYAKAVEAACQRLPQVAPDSAATAAAAVKLVLLAFGTWDPSVKLEEQQMEVKTRYLSALRSTMALSPELLCQSLVSSVLPKLSMASSLEVKNAGSTWKEKSAPWPATRLLFEALTTLLPVDRPADESHPSIAIWRQAWPVFEDVLLRHPVDAASDQPLKAAAEALQRAGSHAPVLLAEALQLFSKSLQERDVSEVLPMALREIVVAIPCPPVDPSKAAELLAAAITIAAEQVLKQSQAMEIPEVLAAQFELLAEAVRPSTPGMAGQGPCEDRLRPLLLNQRVLISRCLSLVSLALPDCTSQQVSIQMLRFTKHLMSNEEAEPEAHRAVLQAALPTVCAALCRALATQDFFAEAEALSEAGELFLSAATVLPEQLPPALSAGLAQLDLPDHSKVLLEQHVQARAEWSKKSHWLEQLQQIVVEWHSERRFTVQ